MSSAVETHWFCISGLPDVPCLLCCVLSRGKGRGSKREGNTFLEALYNAPLSPGFKLNRMFMKGFSVMVVC